MKKSIVVQILIFLLLSLLSLYGYDNNSFFIKQIVWYALGLCLFFLIKKPKRIFKYGLLLYITSNLLLILVLFLGKEINGAKAWFDLGVMSLQPSEIMKFALLIFLSGYLGNIKGKQSYRDEFLIICQVLLILIVPSILTFIEPDTGAVIIYLIITFSILFKFLKHKLWKKLFIIFFVIIISIFFYTYFYESELFLKMFGTNFFYRVDRIMNFYKNDSYQLNNALVQMSQSGLFGLKNVPLRVIEGTTDFIFALLTIRYGFISAIILLINYYVLDKKIIKTIHKKIDIKYQLFINGFLYTFLFQQLYNIWMSIGLVPIMGITLPFISYGGSSLLFFIISLITIIRINDSKDNIDMVDKGKAGTGKYWLLV